MQRRRVDLPEPDEPRITTVSPFFTERSMPFRTWRLPKLLTSPVILSSSTAHLLCDTDWRAIGTNSPTSFRTIVRKYQYVGLIGFRCIYVGNFCFYITSPERYSGTSGRQH